MKAKFPWQENGMSHCFGLNGERICTGAKLGRRDCIPSDFNTVKKLHLRRVRFIDSAYDQGGAYWGIGSPLFCAWGESETEKAVVYFRASNRADAKEQALAAFPNAKFYR